MERLKSGLLAMLFSVGAVSYSTAQDETACLFIDQNTVECSDPTLKDKNNDGVLNQNEWEQSEIKLKDQSQKQKENQKSEKSQDFEFEGIEESEKGQEAEVLLEDTTTEARAEAEETDAIFEEQAKSEQPDTTDNGFTLKEEKWDTTGVFDKEDDTFGEQEYDSEGFFDKEDDTFNMNEKDSQAKAKTEKPDAQTGMEYDRVIKFRDGEKNLSNEMGFEADASAQAKQKSNKEAEAETKTDTDKNQEFEFEAETDVKTEAGTSQTIKPKTEAGFKCERIE